MVEHFLGKEGVASSTLANSSSACFDKRFFCIFEPKLVRLLRQREKEGKIECYDIIRSRWVPLTEEEKVRQFLIHFLIEQRRVPQSHLSVERQITIDGLTRRYDLVVFDSSGNPLLVVECKAPTVALTQKVVEQVGHYNKTLRAPYIGVCNGLQQIYFKIDFDSETIQYLSEIPV